MTAFSFDTHRVVKELEEAGFNQAQAEAVVAALGSAFGGNLATKADLDLLKAELKAEMQNENASLHSEIKSESTSLRSEMQSLELRMTLRLGAIVVVAAAAATAIARFL